MHRQQQPTSAKGATDQTHLLLLSIFYYVFGGLNVLGVCGGAVYIIIGMNAANLPQQGGTPPPDFLGPLITIIGGCISVLSLVFTILDLHAGYAIQKRKHRTAVLITAGITCLSIPLGTALGIFTFIVLSRPSVAGLFGTRVVDVPGAR